jgi:UDPglucose 6-dehydrogenase
VNKSTVPVGTSDSLASAFANSAIRVVTNPEFLAEGSAVNDFFHPDRIVIGTRDDGAGNAVAALYESLHAPIVRTDPISAELTKLASNAFLATKVSFINAIAQICDALGASHSEVAAAVGMDPRIGSGHLRAGLGYGGSCLPKDLAAVESLARRFSAGAELFAAVASVNRTQRTRIIDFLLERFGSLGKRRVAILGAAFKAGTDDIRESPAVALASQLADLHAVVRIYDPVAGDRVRDLADRRFRVLSTAMRALRGADVAIIATDWPEFGKLAPRAVRKALRGDLLIDARGRLDLAEFRRVGLDAMSLSGLQARVPGVAATAAVND